MRTTAALEVELLEKVRAWAMSRGISQGEALDDLVSTGLQQKRRSSPGHYKRMEDQLRENRTMEKKKYKEARGK